MLGFIKTPIAWRDEVKQRGVIRIPKGRSKTYPCHVIYYPCLPTSSSSSSPSLFDDPILQLSDQFKNRCSAVDNERHITYLYIFNFASNLWKFWKFRFIRTKWLNSKFPISSAFKICVRKFRKFRSSRSNEQSVNIDSFLKFRKFYNLDIFISNSKLNDERIYIHTRFLEYFFLLGPRQRLGQIARKAKKRRKSRAHHKHGPNDAQLLSLEGSVVHKVHPNLCPRH